jgi:hypothetical protein
MTERHCIITGTLISCKNNSRAHVIPSALGGRLKPWNILSKAGNTLLGEKVDLPLIQAFQDLMTLLNGSRDRGANQPVRMTDASGRTYVIEFGEPLKLEKPDYQEKTDDEGTTIHINARNLKELRTLLGRIKGKHLNFDIDEAVKYAKTIHTWPDGMLRGQLQIGPAVVFPALFVSASIFTVYHGHPPHPALRNYVARFDRDKPEMPPDTFYFIPSLPWISAPGSVTHIVALLASAKLQKMLVYFELFNAAPVAVLLPYAGSADARATYAVDVLTGDEVAVRIDEETIRDVPWHATHKLGDEEFYRFTSERIGRLIGISQNRAWNAEIEALMTRAFGAGEDLLMTPRDLINGVAELVEFVLRQWERPLTTLEQMEDMLSRFDKLCSNIDKIIDAHIHVFLIFITPHRQKLETFIEQKRNKISP